jgi:hypothetical protein
LETFLAGAQQHAVARKFDIAVLHSVNGIDSAKALSLGYAVVNAQIRDMRTSRAIPIRSGRSWRRVRETRRDMMAARPEIREIDINPLTVYPAGESALALDALIVI